MSQWQRPSLTPIPRRQALTDRLRRIDPRIAARRMLVGVAVLLLMQLGWQWRSATVDLGRHTAVVVVTAPVMSGSDLSEANTRIARWPVGLTPDGALPALPVDAVAAVDLVAGEVLVAGRLFPSPSGLDHGERMVTIPQPLAAPPVARGTRVDLFGILPLGDGLTTPARRLTAGTVVHVTETAISVAIDDASVPTVIEHVTLGTVEVVLLP